ncbi:MAG: NADH-quinone oxidoreductase subunit NuoK [Capsulimonadaceae bacterium]|nr:NADH-quinone oxidoreductase subunit NuoK [Capsulimonadaceae bacterium]
MAMAPVHIPLFYYLIVSAILFALGTIGVIVRRNAIIMFMCIELMLNAVNLSLVAFSRYLSDIGGQLMVIFVMAVAAAEVAVGLGIIVSIFRNRESINIDTLDVMKG